MKKFVYSFNEGSKDMKSLLGGKGANLAEMTKIGLPVPFGFTVTTEACNEYYNQGKKISEDIMNEIFDKLVELENVTGKKFGDSTNPLLVSVRSGSVFSMPGMMDTILNLGLNDETVAGMASLTGNERFAYDSYRRLIMMYSDVVMEKAADIEHDEKKGEKGIRRHLEDEMDKMKESKGVSLDTELTVSDLKKLCATFKQKVRDALGKEFPDDPFEQLWGAVGAVFKSWNGKRAIEYRRIEKIPDEW